MKTKLYLIISAATVFVTYLVLIWVIRLASCKLPITDGVFGVYKDFDFIIALAVAGLVTLALAQRKRNKKK